MPKINRLPKQVADLIAAGEVVERPASAVKELLENSIDAGAKKVTIEIKSGGIRYIRITDDGCGIAREDVRNAFVSHATSKICDESDLDSILTLGFRGEALASIAAVARVEMLTKSKEENIGTRYVIEGGEEVSMDDAGCPDGTTIVIRDLFYNTPARMKFLKKDVSEANAVAAVVDRIALSHPEVSIRFIRDDKDALLTTGDGKADSAVYAVFGRDFYKDLLPIDYTLDNVRITGFVSKPIAARPSRSMQFFFLNGRYIKTGTGSAAVSEAYKHRITVGKFPSCIINITVPAHSVDINVHPAKIEVRFENEKPIFNAIYYAVKNVLDGDRTNAQVTVGNKRPSQTAIKNFYALTEEKPQQMSVGDIPAKRDDFFVTTRDASVLSGTEQRKNDKKESSVAPQAVTENTPGRFVTFSTAESVVKPPLDNDLVSVTKREMSVIPDPVPQEIPPSEDAGEKAVESVQIPDFTVIGEAFKTYIFVESENKILIIDKHAAHERIIYEDLKRNSGSVDTQLLLAPVSVTLRKDEYSAVLENEQLLSEVGFAVSDFGFGTVAVTECPVILDAEDARQAIMEYAVYLCQHKNELVSEKTDWIYHNTACRAAIKGGDSTTDYELRLFVEKLLSMPDIRTCPHGRPVMVEMTRREMEKSFGRI